MIVVKLGGSLYDHPNLRAGLNRWLESVPSPVFVVPGGGPFADAVRELDGIHDLGEVTSHWMALRSLAPAAEFVRSIIACPGVHVVDCYEYCRRNDSLPHAWTVTTDSIALDLAIRERADRLILLKSVPRPNGDWRNAMERGYVDRHFPDLVAVAGLLIESVDFRSWLEDQRNVESA